jgi:hypothetical protein
MESIEKGIQKSEECIKLGEKSDDVLNVARSKGKRFEFFQEPDENAQINVGYMKELSGGDKRKILFYTFEHLKRRLLLKLYLYIFFNKKS